MLLADTMAIVFSVIGLLLAFPALWLVCLGIWPALTENAVAVCRKSLPKSFFLGLPIAVSAFIFSQLLTKAEGPAGQMLPVIWLGLFLIFAQAGNVGVATLIGERLTSPAYVQRPWLRTLRGGIALELSWLLPFVGWFIILPVSICIGLGAATRALWNTRRRKRRLASGGATNEIDSQFQQTQTSSTL